MRSGGPAGRALERYRGAARDHFAARQTRRIARRVSVVGRISIAVNHHEQVAVTDAARVHVNDAGVRCDDVGAVWSGNVEAGVNLVRRGTARVRNLQVKAGAAKPLADAAWPAVWLGPGEHAGAAAGFRRRRLVLD